MAPMSMEEAAARAGRAVLSGWGCSSRMKPSWLRSATLFGLHELAVEDAQNFHMRPKIETYDKDVQLVILRTARYDDAAEEVEFGEISVFLSPTFVITVRQGVASELRGGQAATGAAAGAAGGGQLIRAMGDHGSGGGRVRSGHRRARA